jgi:hypothetical protein
MHECIHNTVYYLSIKNATETIFTKYRMILSNVLHYSRKFIIKRENALTTLEGK